MFSATMTSKGQITIPKAVRDRLGIEQGTQVMFYAAEGRTVRMIPRTSTWDDVSGMFYDPDQPTVSIEEMDEAIGDAIAEDDERIRRENAEERAARDVA